jgi:hypothetical protein
MPPTPVLLINICAWGLRIPIDFFLKSWSLSEVREPHGEINLVVTGRPCWTINQFVSGSRDTMHLPDTTAAAFRRATMVSPVIMPLLVEGREVLPLPPPPPPSSLPPKLLITGSFLKEGALLRRMVGRGRSTAKG